MDNGVTHTVAADHDKILTILDDPTKRFWGFFNDDGLTLLNVQHIVSVTFS